MFSHLWNYRDVQREKVTLSMLWLVLAAMMLGCAGCRAWGTDRGSEHVVPVVEPQQELRVTRTNNLQLILRDAVVSHDTLFGINKTDKTRVAISLQDITRVERRKVTRSSLAATVGVAALGLGLLYLLTNLSLDTSFFPPAT